MTRQINASGLALIKSFEGCQLAPYKDIDGVYTIGYGHTKGVTAFSTPITQDQADAILLADIESFEQVVEDNIDVALNDNQFSALVSLVFNCGEAPLFHTLGDLLNDGDYAGVADEFLKWDHVGGKVSEGLYNRRVKERELFLRPDDQPRQET